MVCKIMKKGLIGLALGGAALGVVSAVAPSYVKTAVHTAHRSVKGSVPIEFEIERARQQISELNPAIERAIESLAKAEVESEDLDKQIAATRKELNEEGRELQALNEHLRTGDVHLTGGVAYSTKEVKDDLVRRMDHYKLIKNVLAEKQETLKIRQKNVLAAREGLIAMQAAKRDLSARVEGAEARLNQMKAARTSNEFTFDDSAVGRAKQTVSELEAKLQEISRVDELKSKYIERGVSITVEPTRDVTKEIEAEFGTGSKDAVKAVEKF